MGIISQTWISGSHTNLNTLTFDEYGNGSRHPLMQNKIPSQQGSRVPSSTGQIARRATDLVRIAKLFTTPPGLKYLANETALNVKQVEFKTRIKKKGKNAGKVDVLGTALNAIGANLFNTVKIIGSTLAQVPLNRTGTHFVKAFKGSGKGTYLSNISTAPHKLALFNGRVFEDEIAPDVSARPDPTTERQPEEDKFAADSILNLLQSRYAPEEGDLKFQVYKPKDLRKEKRLGLGDQGLVAGKSKTSYWVKNDEDMVDKVNMLPPSSTPVEEDKYKDLIKFHFEVVTPKETHWLYFRAYLDNLADSFSANWNAIKYLGRAEDFYTYEGFNRSLDLSFKIAASTRQEMRPLYQKINALASATAPSYTNSGYMTPTFTNVTVGDYIANVPCLIESVSYSWEQDYPWEIALNDPESEEDKDADFDMQELPMILNCSVKLTPLHSFIPQTGAMSYIGNQSLGKDARYVNQSTEGKAGTFNPQP